MYSSKLGQYLATFHADKPGVHAYQDDSGAFLLMGWVDAYGPPPSVAGIDAWTPSPVPSIASMLGSREQQAAQTITQLKASVAAALLSGGMSQGDTFAAGSAFVVQHSAAIQAFILAGGNPVAGQALLDNVLASPPTWWSPAIEAIFEDLLL